MELVENAVDEMMAALKKNRTWNNVGVRGVVNMRLDLELENGSVPDYWHALRTMVIEDLNDVVVNGDRESSNPLLTAIDGEKKLNKSLTDFRISSAILEIEQKPARNLTAYTVYFKILAEFDGEVPAIREATVTKDFTAQR